jgi:hypothetical protein
LLCLYMPKLLPLASVENSFLLTAILVAFYRTPFAFVLLKWLLCSVKIKPVRITRFVRGDGKFRSFLLYFRIYDVFQNDTVDNKKKFRTGPNYENCMFKSLLMQKYKKKGRLVPSCTAFPFGYCLTPSRRAGRQSFDLLWQWYIKLKSRESVDKSLKK